MIEQIQYAIQEIDTADYLKKIQEIYNKQWYLGISPEQISELDKRTIESDCEYFKHEIEKWEPVFIVKLESKILEDSIILCLTDSVIRYDIFLINKQKKIKWTINCTDHIVFFDKGFTEPIVGRSPKKRSSILKKIKKKHPIFLSVPINTDWGVYYLSNGNFYFWKILHSKEYILSDYLRQFHDIELVTP
ncbi:MAG: hypothetical protein IKO90_04335 [Bacteroidales bacterium]|nr:hypothetical protein [Bacteroidales bacterium]MBR4689675.1 hypothetical protein [Bacteroidales bacterium]